MRFALLLLMPLALQSCDSESSRRLGQKVESLGHETTRKAEDLLKSTKEATKEKPTQERGSSPSPSSTADARPTSMQQALQRLEDQRRSQEKEISDRIPANGSKPKSSDSTRTSGSNSAKPNSYQGFPGFEK